MTNATLPLPNKQHSVKIKQPLFWPIFWTIVCFPIGTPWLYWRLSENSKVTGDKTAVKAFLWIIPFWVAIYSWCFIAARNIPPTPSAAIWQQTQSPQDEVAPTKQEIDPKDAAIYAKIKARIAREYPNDYYLQKLMYDKYAEDYEYMKTVTDLGIKKKVERDYPEDYFTQKLMYNKSLDAKEQMRDK